MTASSLSTEQNSALLLNAYVDGELDVARSLEVERQIEADPALAAQAANVIALRKVLSERLQPQTVSPQLRRRIRASIGATDRRPAPGWRALAASILVAAMVSSAATWFVLRGNEPSQLAEVADAHMRSLVAAKPFDVASSERHVVKPWFGGKLPYSPKVVDLAAAGYPLAGARVDVIDASPVAALVYNRRLHVINLFARPVADSTGASVRQHSLKGYNVVTWTDRGTEYWAISDLNSEELKAFAELFRTAS